ncbi:hypothetical protein B7463_g3932, partial [Scytalidium lignicola]
MKTLSAKNSAALDKELMSTGGFSIDQLMELAGLSVSQAVVCGPGNNGKPDNYHSDHSTETKLGGDGLVAARHLWQYGYKPTIYYPKQSKNELYQRLCTQLKSLDVPFTEDFSAALKETDHIVDAIFGFSFSGEVREPFGTVIQALEETSVPVTSVDAPSSWNIEEGPPKSGPGAKFNPATLISLTAPKPLVKWFKGRHFIGGRFITPEIAKKFDIEFPPYQGIDQIVEVGVEGQKL